MNKKRILFMAIAGVMGVFWFSLSGAGGHNRPLVLEATQEHPDAVGTAVIDNAHVSVQARGLRPGSVYTVWFVNATPRKDETGAGVAPFMFRTDTGGKRCVQRAAG